ncbi:ABC transporter permease [Vagococcus vulneris]|uniref:Putative hemin transport system permease protein HrtB n=1 Tax=Vagococcus vulneris TaxID=1977869 RepID=A0A430A1M0_9ENTE|nr:ABC transporter permease [Vagococcus vulneris]RSU00283.1 ABC transporter permease [Vagococcus vulneris]
MFLAIKEIKYSKLRYTLIIGIMFLISFMVFMLSGLANGLSRQFSQAVIDWHAKTVVMSEESNRILAASQLSLDNLKEVDGKSKVPLTVYSGSVKDKNNKTNISVFGTEKGAFFLPKTTSGSSFKKDNEITISQNLADVGFKVGDTISLGSDNTKLKVVGITKATYYQATPVLYTTTKTVTDLKFGDKAFKNNKNYPINAILTDATDTHISSKSLDKMSSQKFIESIPGYTAQDITLKAMIYFLFIIAVAIIGIFMYVITLQKTAIFGVMKVQGISDWFISKSIIAQSFLVGFIGVTLSGIVSYALQFGLPKAMPFAVNLPQWLIYGGILIIMSILGGIFSILTVRKVDPIKAIG